MFILKFIWEKEINIRYIITTWKAKVIKIYISICVSDLLFQFNLDFVVAFLEEEKHNHNKV